MDVVEVLKDQRQELERGVRELALVPREAEQKINMGSKLIQVVSGVRRCGKSVLLYKLLQGKSFGYVNFDDDRLVDAEPNEILSGVYQIYGPHLRTLFLDEIQNLLRWELFVNRLHRAGFRLFVTGSNAKLLAKELSTHLTGRHITIELFPFSFREFLLARQFHDDVETTRGRSLVMKHLQEYVSHGGFPEIVVGREDAFPYLRELYRKIVERDIVSRYNISYKKTLREISRSIMSNPARYLRYGKIRRQFGMGSDHTVKNYISYLEEAYLVVLLNKFSFKPREIEKSDKKAYCIDPGILSAVSLQQGKDQGPLYENVVALELLRQFDQVYYWKNVRQEEVDFVIRQGGNITQLIQVCYDVQDETTRKREIRALLDASKELKCKHLLIITKETAGEEKVTWFGLKGSITFVPLWKWLLRKPQQ